MLLDIVWLSAFLSRCGAAANDDTNDDTNDDDNNNDGDTIGAPVADGNVDIWSGHIQ